MKRWLVVAALALAGCSIDPKVPRLYEGDKLVEGPFVPPEAYSAYLRGVLDEEAGDAKGALAAYEDTIREDDEDPEPFTRIGDLRCKLDPKDRAADARFGDAAAIDAHYAPLLEARARCAAARGQDAQALAIVDSIRRADRTVSIEVVWASLAKAPGARDRVIALTVAAGEHVAAWDALIAWARAHHDPQLLAEGLVGLLEVAPLRAREVEAGALELLGAGQTVLARGVAAAVAGAPSENGVDHVHDATVARLAIDHALERNDLELAERRATRGHVSQGEVAARAALLEKPYLATSLAKRILAADPADSCAVIVASLSLVPGDPSPKPGAMADRPPAVCALLMTRRLADTNPEAARTFLQRVHPEAPASHDPLVAPIAVDLAVRGVIADPGLPVELRVETAARRHEAPPQVDPTSLDAKHALLFHALTDPTGAAAQALLTRIGAAADRDPLVGYALARAALASTTPAPIDARVRAAIAAAPANPLMLAIAVELAKKSGQPDAPARTRLLAVARTAAERALASGQ